MWASAPRQPDAMSGRFLHHGVNPVFTRVKPKLAGYLSRLAIISRRLTCIDTSFRPHYTRAREPSGVISAPARSRFKSIRGRPEETTVNRRTIGGSCSGQ
jgi:hypothetical protein